MAYLALIIHRGFKGPFFFAYSYHLQRESCNLFLINDETEFIGE